MDAKAATCPVDHGRDDRKSAKLAQADMKANAGSRVVGTFFAGREILRSTRTRQAGGVAESVDHSKPDDISFFFLDGDLHRKRRAAVAGFFAPKTIVTRHHKVMNRTMDQIVANLRQKGSGILDEMSWRMAVDVAAEIVGLTNSDSNENLARRVKTIMDFPPAAKGGWLSKLIHKAKMAYYVSLFWKHDLKPAVEARRKHPADDVISTLVKDKRSRQGIIIECLSYAGAGMLTTREFIVMAAWHLFDNPGLRTRFLNGGEDDQFAILEEILRLEPVAALLYRRPQETVKGDQGGDMQEGELVCINLRDANTDAAIAGSCPYELDPDRAKRMKVVGPYLSFGDGPHRCPGAQVALHETRIFLDRMLRVPGIRLVREPEITWNTGIQGYELRGAVVGCDPA